MINDEDKVRALAAGAAGAKRTDHSDGTPDYWEIKHPDGIWRKWDPLNDDGDALRLAVKLGMFTDPKRHSVFTENLHTVSRFYDMPPTAATRYAIVSTAIKLSQGGCK